MYRYTQVLKFIGMNKEKEMSSKQVITSVAQIRKYKHGCKIHSTYTYYCWSKSLLVFFLLSVPLWWLLLWWLTYWLIISSLFASVSSLVGCLCIYIFGKSAIHLLNLSVTCDALFLLISEVILGCGWNGLDMPLHPCDDTSHLYHLYFVVSAIVFIRSMSS